MHQQHILGYIIVFSKKSNRMIPFFLISMNLQENQYWKSGFCKMVVRFSNVNEAETTEDNVDQDTSNNHNAPADTVDDEQIVIEAEDHQKYVPPDEELVCTNPQVILQEQITITTNNKQLMKFILPVICPCISMCTQSYWSNFHWIFSKGGKGRSRHVATGYFTSFTTLFE